MPGLRLELPPNVVLFINTDKITPNQMDDLADKLGEINYKNSIFAKYPMEEGEDHDTWKERISPKLLEDRVRKPGEATQDYMTRVFKVETDKKSVLKDTLTALAEVFSPASKITPEVFSGGSYMEMKKFVCNVLKACDFNATDFE